MLLDATNKSVEILLGAVKTTNDCQITANWTDVTTTSGNPSGFVGGSSDGVTNGPTAVTAVAAPGSGSIQRRIRMLSVFNSDTVATTVIVQINNAGTTRIIKKATILPNSVLLYIDGVWVSQVVAPPAGGATGNVLTKTSGTDFDFAWAAAGGAGGTDVQIFGAGTGQTWTKPAGTPKAVYVVCFGAGGGGSGGAASSSGVLAAGGGAGGGGGSKKEGWFKPSDLGGTETVNVGTGGTGGAGAATVNVVGSAGGIGGDTSFGAWIKAYGGGGGGAQNGTSNFTAGTCQCGGGGGAGLTGAGTSGTATAAGTGGTYGPGAAGGTPSGATAAALSGADAPNMWTGGGGAAQNPNQNVNGVTPQGNGGNSMYGAAGGGAGSGRGGSNNSAFEGPGSGGVSFLGGMTAAPGGTGFGGASPVNGSNGQTGSLACGGGGGGGGACGRDVNGSNGGDGGSPGGGGGGGGAGIPVNTACHGGNGGKGGDGICVVVTFS